MKNITLQQFNGALTKAGNIAQATETIASYAIFQAAVHDNTTPMVNAFNHWTKDPKTGQKVYTFLNNTTKKLNNDGKNLRNYITAHYKAVAVKECSDTKRVTVAFKANATDETRHHLVDLDLSTDGLIFREKTVKEEGVILRGYRDFLDNKVTPKKPAVKPFTVKQLTARMTKLAGDITTKGVDGLPDELHTLMAELATLQTALQGAIANSTCSVEVEETALEQVQGVKPSIASTAAPKVV